jgi:hypothetical protein
MLPEMSTNATAFTACLRREPRELTLVVALSS